MLFDYLVLPLASLPLVIGFVRGKDGVGNKDRFVPGLLEDDLDKDFGVDDWHGHNAFIGNAGGGAARSL